MLNNLFDFIGYKSTKTVLGAVFLLFFLIVFTLVMMMVFHRHMMLSYPPRQDTIVKTRIELLTEHLTLEEMLAGDRKKDYQKILEEENSTFKQLLSLKKGKDKFLILDTDKQKFILEKSIKEYKKFMLYSKKRTVSDIKDGKNEILYHQEFYILMKNLKILHNLISVEYAQKEDIFHHIQFFLIFSIIFLFFVASFILAGFGKKRDYLIDSLQTLNKDLENRVLQRTKELQEKIDYIEKTQKLLIENEKMASLGVLVAGVSHEINTPIGNSYTATTYINDMTKNMQIKYKNSDISKKDLESYLEESLLLQNSIIQNLERSAKLVKSFKQIAVDKSVSEKRKFVLVPYIKEVLLSLHNIVKNTNISINVNGSDDIVVNSNPGDCAQIITNLIQNALIHAFAKEEKGTIDISVSENEKSFILIFKDDGCGIEESVRAKIFDPFFTTNREGGGSGLGLHIVYNIITQGLNGTITCESQVDIGTIFKIVMPKDSYGR